jgi:hypothetical protein
MPTFNLSLGDRKRRVAPRARPGGLDNTAREYASRAGPVNGRVRCLPLVPRPGVRVYGRLMGSHLGASRVRRPLAAAAATAVVAALLSFARPVVAADADAPASEGGRPPPPTHEYLQYGVAFTIEAVASAGPACSVPGSSDIAAKLAAAGCILGSGGGIAARIGWRLAPHTYLGGAYEFSKQDPNNLYRLGILQQARVEGRRYFDTGWRTIPFATVGAGFAAYGNEWGVDTWGFTGELGAGLEFELSGAAALGFSIVYRPVYLRY